MLDSKYLNDKPTFESFESALVYAIETSNEAGDVLSALIGFRSRKPQGDASEPEKIENHNANAPLPCDVYAIPELKNCLNSKEWGKLLAKDLKHPKIKLSDNDIEPTIKKDIEIWKQGKVPPFIKTSKLGDLPPGYTLFLFCLLVFCFLYVF